MHGRLRRTSQRPGHEFDQMAGRGRASVSCGTGPARCRTWGIPGGVALLGARPESRPVRRAPIRSHARRVRVQLERTTSTFWWTGVQPTADVRGAVVVLGRCGGGLGRCSRISGRCGGALGRALGALPVGCVIPLERPVVSSLDPTSRLPCSLLPRSTSWIR